MPALVEIGEAKQEFFRALCSRIRKAGYRGFKGYGGHKVVGKREVARSFEEKLPFELQH
jgi:hypothetical protein